MQGSALDLSLQSRIASLVHSHFDGLPKRSKPSIRDDGTAEWIPMTGIVVVKGENTPSEDLTCVTVTTGAKCLSTSQIRNCKGLVLHDWHAEILALRAFNFWLLSECQGVLAHERQHPSAEGEEHSPSPYIRRRNQCILSVQSLPPFELHPDITIYMYCTCAPCGDASMELCMAAQPDPTPWETTPSPATATSTSTTGNDHHHHLLLLLNGRAHFSRLGIVRRKPSRPDAEPTKSKSCSDKLALRQVSSLLSYETSLLVAPTVNAYISGLILPQEEISRPGCERAFGEAGRMGILRGRGWSLRGDGIETPSLQGCQYQYQYQYTFRPFKVLAIPTEQLRALWPFRKPTPGESILASGKKSKPGMVSVVWVRAPTGCPDAGDAENGSKTLPTLRGSRTGLFENIVNGVKQGHRVSEPGVRGASALSRAKLWGFLREIAVAPFPGGGLDLNEGGCGEMEEKQSTEGGFDAALGVLRSLVGAESYTEFKKDPRSSSQSIEARKRAIRETKGVLDGWIPNTGDEDWGLEVLVDSKKRKR